MNESVRTASSKCGTSGLRGLCLIACALTMFLACMFANSTPAYATLWRGRVEDAAEEIYQALAEHREGPIDISAYKLKDQYVYEAWTDVLKAHPELFDVRNVYFEEVIDPETGATLLITPEYFLTDRYGIEQILQMRQKAREGFEEAMASIPVDGTDLEKAKAAYEWLCKNVKLDVSPVGSLDIHKKQGIDPKLRALYGWVTPDTDRFYCFSAYGAFAERTCSCAGFADAFDALMDQFGIRCDSVLDQYHCWDRVYIDGILYNVDAGQDSAAESGEAVSYAHFLKSDEGMRAAGFTHAYADDEKNYNFNRVYSNAIDTRYDSWAASDWENTAA